MSVVGWIAVGLLGGLSAGARFLIDAEISDLATSPFPLGILAVNLSGALALGLLAGLGLGGDWLVILAGGAVGSFTTFSTWILDSHRLGDSGRAGLAGLNVGVSIAAGFAALALGHWIGGAL